MRFSATFLSALLATSAAAYPSEINLSENNAAILATRAVPPLTWTPSSQSSALYSQYCSSASKKRDLKARAQPPGSTEVAAGAYIGAKANEPTLWTGGLGTCASLALTGTAGASGVTRFLFHMSLQSSTAELQKSWNSFATAVQNSGLRITAAILYTVETRQNVLTDPTEKQEASYVEPDYAHIASSASQLAGITCGRRYHAWNAVGEETIASNNAINPYTS